MSSSVFLSDTRTLSASGILNRAPEVPSGATSTNGTSRRSAASAAARLRDSGVTPPRRTAPSGSRTSSMDANVATKLGRSLSRIVVTLEEDELGWHIVQVQLLLTARSLEHATDRKPRPIQKPQDVFGLHS